MHVLSEIKLYGKLSFNSNPSIGSCLSFYLTRFVYFFLNVNHKSFSLSVSPYLSLFLNLGTKLYLSIYVSLYQSICAFACPHIISIFVCVYHHYLSFVSLHNFFFPRRKQRRLRKGFSINLSHLLITFISIPIATIYFPVSSNRNVSAFFQTK